MIARAKVHASRAALADWRTRAAIEARPALKEGFVLHALDDHAEQHEPHPGAEKEPVGGEIVPRDRLQHVEAAPADHEAADKTPAGRKRPRAAHRRPEERYAADAD